MEKRNRSRLSQSVLEMKFMKKTKEKLEQEKEDEEGQVMYSKELKHMFGRSGNINFVEVSIANCCDLIDGRLSFQGMNPEVELLMKDEYAKKLDEAERLKEMDISDMEMAKGMSSLRDTLDNKFKTKKQKGAKKRKFAKPNEDYDLM